MFRRLKRLFGIGEQAALLGAIHQRLEDTSARLARLEEASAYFAQRSNPYFHAPTTFLGDYTVLALLEGRLPIYLDTRGADLAPHVMMFGIWEPNYTKLFQRLIRPGDTVLDLGAHLGVYALLGAARTGHQGIVHAFEPNPRYAQLLGQSLAVNGFAGFAKVHALAVGEAEGKTSLRWCWELGGGGYITQNTKPLRPGYRSVEARVVALDEFFPDPSFTVDVMKMDIEGTEPGAVKGALKLLERSPRLRILFEFGPKMLTGHGSSPAELIGMLDGLGFRFWSVEADSSLTPEPTAALAARTQGLTNLLASRQDPETA